MAETVVGAKTLKFNAKFERGARALIQFLRATISFNGKPYLEHLRYKTDNGKGRWGEARLVLRNVGPDRHQCVVVTRLCVAAPRPGWVLKAHGCQRLSWHFSTPQSVWPTVEVVDAPRVLRLESIVPEWRDSEERCGVTAKPSEKPRTPEELLRERFFVNVLYPWTSRPAVSGEQRRQKSGDWAEVCVAAG